MITLSPAMSGTFDIAVTRAGGEVERRCHNVVLDAALPSLAEGLWLGEAWHVADYLFFGTGESEPSVSDTGLQDRGTVPGKLTSGPERYNGFLDAASGLRRADVTLRYDYAPGELTGRWMEVGAARDAGYTQPYNRSLIRDENGLPTPLVVLSTDSVSVRLTLRLQEGLRFPLDTTLTLDGQSVPVTLHPVSGMLYSKDGDANAWAAGLAGRIYAYDEEGGVIEDLYAPRPQFRRDVTWGQTINGTSLDTWMDLPYSRSDAIISRLALGGTPDPATHAYEIELPEPIIKHAEDSMRLSIKTMIDAERGR